MLLFFAVHHSMVPAAGGAIQLHPCLAQAGGKSFIRVATAMRCLFFRFCTALFGVLGHSPRRPDCRRQYLLDLGIFVTPKLLYPLGEGLSEYRIVGVVAVQQVFGYWQCLSAHDHPL